MRIALGIEYDGSRYHGWQRQPGLMTVQEQVERALSKVADHPVEVYCAGRTDTAVHAVEQVAHFESSADRSSRNWIYGVNSNIQNDICIRWAKTVPNTFHARFSAKTRRYRYIIFNHHVPPTHLRHLVTWNYRPLDVDRMHRAAQALIGEHDFTSYRALECQSKSSNRNIHQFTVSRKGNLVVIDVTANAFLHHMVRNMVGVLTAIGTGRKPVEWAKEVLEIRNRSLGGVTAPAYGLYLVKVAYPEEFAMPDESPGPFFLV